MVNVRYPGTGPALPGQERICGAARYPRHIRNGKCFSLIRQAIIPISGDGG